MNIGLKIVRQGDETWRECAMRYATKYRLEYEVAEAYDASIEAGDSESEAAWSACYEWDICDLHQE